MRLFGYLFIFGRVCLVPQTCLTHEHRAYVRTREQAASLIRLGAKLSYSKVVSA